MGYYDGIDFKKHAANKKIIKAHRDDDSIHLEFEDGSKCALTPYGDCCANCYIYHTDDINELVGAELLDMKNKWHVTNKGDEKDELGIDNHCVKETGFITFKTSKGYFDVELRLEHNSYYYGELLFEELEDLE